MIINDSRELQEDVLKDRATKKHTSLRNSKSAKITPNPPHIISKTAQHLKFLGADAQYSYKWGGNLTPPRVCMDIVRFFKFI